LSSTPSFPDSLHPLKMTSTLIICIVIRPPYFPDSMHPLKMTSTLIKLNVFISSFLLT
jgi:hypothetical protein